MMGLKAGVLVGMTTLRVAPREALSREYDRQDGERRYGSEGRGGRRRAGERDGAWDWKPGWGALEEGRGGGGGGGGGGEEGGAFWIALVSAGVVGAEVVAWQPCPGETG